MTTQFIPFISWFSESYRYTFLAKSFDQPCHIIATFIIMGTIGIDQIWLRSYNDVIMGPTASQITSLTILFFFDLDTDQRKHQSSASLPFVRGIPRRPGNFPHKWPVTRKMFPFDNAIMSKIFHVYKMRNRNLMLAISKYVWNKEQIWSPASRYTFYCLSLPLINLSLALLKKIMLKLLLQSYRGLW